MKKVMILQRVISFYNVPLYREINKTYHVTLAYSEKTETPVTDMEMIQVNYPTSEDFQTMPKKVFEESIMQLEKACHGFDVLIMPMEPHAMVIHVIERMRRKLKVILWGIGVAAGYNTRYDSKEYLRPSFESMAAIADANVFYTPYPVNKYREHCIPEEKMFVAHNTVEVIKTDRKPYEKDCILFVGTLLHQKRIDILLEAYRQCLLEKSNLPELIIIGQGEEFQTTQQWITDNHLTEKIHLKGAIYEETVLKDYFLRAYAVISPDQAGLSVLKAMGYGVPFITNMHAITGGEIFNIENGINGVLLEDLSQLKDVLLDIADNPEKYRKMGENAYQHYHLCRTIPHCAKGFLDAIGYVTA